MNYPEGNIHSFILFSHLAGKVDSPSGTLRTPNSTASRTSSQSKLNAVAAVASASAKLRGAAGVGAGGGDDGSGSTRHTKLPQIPNTIA